MQNENLDIRLNLLSGDNVILAKCDGLKTEVFMPAIIEGRISIVNVIPQRRCNCFSTTHLVAKRRNDVQPTHSPSDSLSNWRVSMSSTSVPQKIRASKHTSNPLANSTPASIGVNEKSKRLRYESPEVVRGILADVNTSIIAPIAMVNRSQQFNGFGNVQWPTNSYDNSIYYGSPSFGKINNTTPAAKSSDMCWSQTPRLIQSPNNTIPRLESPTRPWRKVITPLRTYARQKHSLNTSFRPLLNEVPEHHLNNATQGPISQHIVKFKMRKVVVDKKIGVSPRSFKRQLESKPAAIRYDEYRKEQRKLFLCMSRTTAFDLLTSSSFRSVSKAESLKIQFRNRCVNKASSTYPKYKKLCAIDPVETKDRPLNNFSVWRGEPARISRQEVQEMQSTTTNEQIKWSVPRKVSSKSAPRIPITLQEANLSSTSTIYTQGARKTLFPLS